MKIYLACYDITDDGIRLEISKILGQYGDRVQRSVFEVRLRNDAELDQLRGRLMEVVGSEPELRLYRLCERCRGESQTLAGERVAVFPSTIIL